jgi:CubicO group peptidase (beta-lactamase class C family)
MMMLAMSALVMATPMTVVTKASAQSKMEAVKEMAQAFASVMVNDYGVSGLQYAIMDKGAITLSDSAGVHDKATQAKVTEDTMFGIGSVSKMHVSAATMILADSNKIDIDKPLTTYIEDFAMADERYKEITPRMLMNHSSGLFGTHYGNSMLFEDSDTQNHDELLIRLQSERLKSDPGEYSVYCNDGFQLLEILVERVSGLSYSEFLDKNISDPLELTATKTPLDEFDRQQLAKTYYPTMEQALPVESTNVLGAGGIYSTAEELLWFNEVLIGNRTDILSEQAAKAMQSHEYKKGIWVSDERNTINYGLGWDAVSLAPFSDYGITALTKGGDTNMYHAALTAIPEYDISIAVLTSGGSSIFNGIFASNVLLEYLKDTGKIKEIQSDKTFEPAIKVEMPAELKSYTGAYGTVGATAHIEVKDGEVTLPGLIGGFIPPQKYVYTGNRKFTSSDGSTVVSFDEQKNGKTYLQLNANLIFPGIGQQIMVTYEYQKIDANPLDEATQKVWEKRNNKTYYALNEKITSMAYLSPAALTKNIVLDQGYASVLELWMRIEH